MPDSLGHSHTLIQVPAGASQQLFLLLHGYGADQDDLLDVGQVLAHAYPQATIVSLQAPQECELGQGYQWFSLLDVQEGTGPNSRVPRVVSAMTSLAQRVAHWQKTTQVQAQATMLLGFSQGATMALEYAHAQTDIQTQVGRVLALSGRFATLPTQALSHTTVHWIHGKEDNVIHYGFCVEAAKHLVALGADITADVLPHLGHGIDNNVLALMLKRLQEHIPKRLWEQALQADPEQSAMVATQDRY